MSPEKDVVLSTLTINSNPENRLLAVKLYCEGVKEDFPETKTWMDNILFLAGFKQET